MTYVIILLCLLTNVQKGIFGGQRKPLHYAIVVKNARKIVGKIVDKRAKKSDNW